MVEKLVSDPFLKNLNWADQLSKVLYSLFLLYAKLRAIDIYWKYAADRLLLPNIKLL